MSIWEERLTPLALSLEPVKPPASVWKDVERRVGLANTRAGVGLWRAVAASFAAAALVFGLLFFATPPPEPRTDYVIVLQDEAQSPQWFLSGSRESRNVVATAVNVQPPPADRDYELWMLPDDGSPPVSLGLLGQSGETRIALSVDQQQILASTTTLAVSLEPQGGSTTGAPTGPVLFTGAIIRI